MTPLIAALSSIVLVATPVAPTSVAPILVLSGEVSTASVAPLARFLHDAGARKTPDVTLFIDSPGGENRAGNVLIAAMLEARAAGVRITCVVDNAASMAAIIFEAGCDVRKLRLDGYLLFHETAYAELATGGGIRLTNTVLRLLADGLARVDAATAARIAPRMGMTPDVYLAWIAGADRTVSAPDALARGMIDEIFLPQ